MTKIIGIDYSLTCPCCCIFESEDLSYENAKFYYLTSTKKYEGVFLDGKVIGDRIEDYTNQQERHDNISNWVFKRAVGNSINPTGFIEDYSFGSKGRVFNLAENTGLLKHKLYKKNMKFVTLVPSVIKKMATGKGNADKTRMYDKWYEETGINLMEALDQQTLSNPVTDIVDAFYIARCVYDQTMDRDKE